MYSRLRGGRRAEVLFPYSKLHKSFEKGFGGKLFQKFSPKNFKRLICCNWKRSPTFSYFLAFVFFAARF